MIIVPLGLGRRIPKFPILTVLLTVVTAIYSIFCFSEVKSLEIMAKNARTEAGLIQLTSQMGLELCQARQMVQSQCQTIKKTLDLYDFEFQGKITHKEFTEKVARLLRARAESEGLSPTLAISDARDIKGFLETYTAELESQSDLVKNLPSFSAFIRAKEQVDSIMTGHFRQHHILAAGSLHPLSILKSQVVHSGWLHLIGNLVFFLVFAIYVENRLRRSEFMMIYLFGGTVALVAEILLSAPKGTCVIGASANISAMMGAFFILFFRRDMRILASLIFYNKILSCPTWILFPILFIAGDLTGTLNGGSGVAHFAHLVGLIVGCAFAYLLLRLENLDSDLLYPVEEELCLGLMAQSSSVGRIKQALVILKYNERNTYAITSVLNLLVTDVDGLNAESNAFLKEYFSTFVNRGIERGRLAEIDAVIEKIPMPWRLSEYVTNVSQNHLLGLAKRQVNQHHWLSSIRLHDCYLIRFPRGPKSALVKQSAEGLLQRAMTQVLSLPAEQKAEQVTAFLEDCDRFATTQMNSPLRKAILNIREQMSQQVKGEHHVRSA